MTGRSWQVSKKRTSRLRTAARWTSRTLRRIGTEAYERVRDAIDGPPLFEIRPLVDGGRVPAWFDHDRGAVRRRHIGAVNIREGAALRLRARRPFVCTSPTHVTGAVLYLLVGARPMPISRQDLSCPASLEAKDTLSLDFDLVLGTIDERYPR